MPAKIIQRKLNAIYWFESTTSIIGLECFSRLYTCTTFSKFFQDLFSSLVDISLKYFIFTNNTYAREPVNRLTIPSPTPILLPFWSIFKYMLISAVFLGQKYVKYTLRLRSSVTPRVDLNWAFTDEIFLWLHLNFHKQLKI